MADEKADISRGEHLKQILKDFADNTSCHGIGSIGRSTSTFFKILWTIIVSTFTIIMLIQLTLLVKKYYSYPTRTVIEVGSGTLDFPSVTVCNINSIRKSAIEESTDPEYANLRKLYLQAKKYHETLGRQTGDDFLDFEPTLNDSYEGDDIMADGWADETAITLDGEDDREYEFRHNFDLESAKLSVNDFLEIGHQKEILIQKCVFMGKECSSKNFTTLFHSKYGLCHTFNSNEYDRSGGRMQPLLVKRSGRDYGLNLILNIEYSDYIPIKTSGFGARLVIHQFGTFAAPLGHGISIPAGFTTSLAVTQKRISRLDYPYGDCENGSDMYEVYEKIYTQQACERFCRHRHIFRICNCYQEGYVEYYPRKALDAGLESCALKDEGVDCLKSVEEQFVSDDIECECLHPCQESHFLQTLSVHQWPEKNYRKVVALQACENAKKHNRTDICAALQAMTLKDTRNNFVKLRVYYKDLNFESITQKPSYLIPDFLADVGGTLGLWAGISVLTGAELIMLIISIARFLAQTFTGRTDSNEKCKTGKDGESKGSNISVEMDQEKEAKADV
ncbi:amiloride-sensitive sodium channel subunit beta-like [Lineus longissimus]|uniref:amiloride-sensitive sodium channel subunit beta-like n=1 Tax=Lineus longissimus TaxID=88925 RepID=UPI002B4F2B69